MKNQKKAVILLNMGGVSKKKDVKTFLTNMFNDRFIIRVKSDLLRSFLAKMIVFFRLKEAQENYAVIEYKSVLLDITKKTVALLQKNLPKVYITFAMRYTKPFCKKAILKIKKRGIEDIFLLPLYPQYSTTTTKSSIQDAFAQIEKNIPNAKITFINRFYENKQLISLIVDNIQDTLPKKENIKK